jgi:hypothetical protein
LTTHYITDRLNAIFDWMEANRAVNLLLVLAYVAFILFGHDTFVNVSIAVMTALTLPVYNMVVGAITVAVGAVFVGVLFLFLRKDGPQRPRQIFYLSAIVLMLVLHHFFLFEMNIEVIHAALYAGLALVLFPLTRRPGATIILALPVMMLDEWYQYIILYPEHVLYFDFNDILMDMLGCALLLCGLWIMGLSMRPSYRPFLLRMEILLLTAIVAGCVIATGLCIVALFPETSCDNTLFVVNALPDPMEFWRTHPFTGRTYHALPPVAGLAVVTLAALFFTGLGTSPEGGQ